MSKSIKKRQEDARWDMRHALAQLRDIYKRLHHQMDIECEGGELVITQGGNQACGAIYDAIKCLECEVE